MGAGCSSDNDPQLTKKAPAIPGLKIVIVGDSEVGKTSVFLRYLHNQYCPLYIPTKKVHIDNVVQKINQPSHALVSLTLWDTPAIEEINLYSTYFRDVDAIIVVADLTDETSIRMAPVWKQLALNSATVSGQNEQVPGTLQIPVMLLGNKLDVIEEQLLAELSEKGEPEEVVDEKGEVQARLKKSRPKIPKPEVVKFLEEIADKAYFAASAVVSAKSGDGSVIRAIKLFVRHIMERRGKLTRRWQPKIIEDKEARSRDRQGGMLEPVGIEQFDDLFNQGQVLVTRVASLKSHFKETLQHFQTLCVKAKVTSEDNNSLENCLVGLKETLTKDNIKLKLSVTEGFCQLEAKATENVEIEQHIRYALKAFNKEFAAVCLSSLKELPTISASLTTLDDRLDRLCKEYKVPPPPPPGSKTPATNNTTTGDSNTNNSTGNNNKPGNNKTTDNSSVNVKTASQIIEKNRGLLTHTKHQASELVITMENALKRARTAFVW